MNLRCLFNKLRDIVANYDTGQYPHFIFKIQRAIWALLLTSIFIVILTKIGKYDESSMLWLPLLVINIS